MTAPELLGKPGSTSVISTAWPGWPQQPENCTTRCCSSTLIVPTRARCGERRVRPNRNALKRRTDMRAMRAEAFRGYEDLKLADVPKPAVSEGRVLVKITAAGVTPLDHTILSGGYARAKAPLVLGSEGAGVIEDANGSTFSNGARVMFCGPYGVSEDGAYSEYLAVKTENLSLIPANIDDVSAAGLPVAYLTAHMA